MKHVLVTGGAGFIGTHLCKALLDAGNRVTCIDSFYSGSERNIRQFKKNPLFKHINHDVRDPLAIECQEIYHLACPASPVAYQKDPLFTLETGIMGTKNMLGLAKKNNARILFTSTSEVYGDPLKHPQKETYWGNVNPIGIRSCYDEGKRAAETMCMDFVRMHHLNVAIVRIFNTYGPYMTPDDGRVVSNFIMQSLKGKEITIYGDGTQTRSFCYVSDMVIGLMKMMASNETGPINLGNPCEFTISQLAQKIVALTGTDSKIVYKKLPKDDPKIRKPDIAFAKAKLGWEPSVKLEDGLKKTIDYFSQL